MNFEELYNAEIEKFKNNEHPVAVIVTKDGGVVFLNKVETRCTQNIPTIPSNSTHCHRSCPTRHVF